jgi:hypothetical protein
MKPPPSKPTIVAADSVKVVVGKQNPEIMVAIEESLSPQEEESFL